MGHSEASRAPGKNHSRAGRDGGLRGRARVSRPRTTHDALNARQVFYEGGADTTILLGIEDVTAQRILEREKDELLRQFEEARAFAQAIVDTVREPFLVLDQDLRVLAASRSFYSAFKVSPEDTQGRLLYALGDGQWDIPKLHLLLEKIVPEHGVMEGYEVEHEFPGLGHRTMLLNARKVFYEGGSHTTILLGIEDVTEQRALEREKDELLRQKDVLFEELQHRVANSLQIIASIILMKARRGAIGRDARPSARRAQAGHVGCRRAAAAPCLRQHRHRRNRPYLTGVRQPCNLDDRRQSAYLAESGWRGGALGPRRREPRLDRDRAGDECAQACVPGRKAKGRDRRRL